MLGLKWNLGQFAEVAIAPALDVFLLGFWILALSELAKAKAYYAQLQDKACLEAANSLRDAGLPVRIMRVSRRAIDYVAAHWEPAGRHPECAHWDWSEILRTNRTPKFMDMSFWSMDDRLVALAAGVITKEAAILKYVEGDPRDDCAFRGKRVPMALEAMTNYGQIAGLNEIRVEPVNEALATLYEKVYGFELVTGRKTPSYFRKAI